MTRRKSVVEGEDTVSQHHGWTTAAEQYNDVIGKITLHGTARLVDVVHALHPFNADSYYNHDDVATAAAHHNGNDQDRDAAAAAAVADTTAAYDDHYYHVLDVGAGGGSLTVTVKNKDPGARVLATDISPGMLAEIGRLGLPGVGTRRADAVTLAGLPDGRFSHALSSFAVQFTRDAAAAVRSLCRVTRPGGIVGVAIWGEAMGAAVVANRACANLRPGFVPAPPAAKGAWHGEAAHRRALEEAGLERVGTERCLMPFEAGGVQGVLDYWFRSTNPVPAKMLRRWEEHGGSRDELEREYARLLREMEANGEPIVCEAILGWGRKPLA